MRRWASFELCRAERRPVLNPGGKMLGGPPKGDLWLVLVEAGENKSEPEVAN